MPPALLGVDRRGIVAFVSSRTKLGLGRVMVRPYAAAGSPWELVVVTICVAVLVIVFLAEILTPHDVVGALALLPLLVATWVLSSRPASLVMLLAALLFSAVVVVERANELTVISIGVALLVMVVVTRLYATALARSLASHRHARRNIKDSDAPMTLAAFEDSSHGMWSLTHRELEVARLAAEGYTAAEIGKRLHIGQRTVESHLDSTYSKLHINSKAQLIRMASKLETPLS